MTAYDTRRWRLVSRPVGALQPGDLTLEEVPAPALRDGQVLLRNRIISIDPTTRLWLSSVDQKADPIAIGDTVRAFVYGEVIESRRAGFEPGDLAFGIGGWADLSVLDAPEKLPGPADMPMEAHASVIGMTGLTAWFGVQDLCRPMPGETMVVSAAAGAVGLIAAQLGKIAGAHVVGIVGDAEKGERLVRDFGLDGWVLRQDPDFAGALRSACPKGIDICFENVGGAVLDGVLAAINPGARIIICGLIAGYEAKDGWPRHDLRPILMKRARIEGLLISHYWRRFGEGAAALADLVRAGRLKWDVDIAEGLEQAPAALMRVMAGANRGKMLVRL